jgi:hypothetical protein
MGYFTGTEFDSVTDMLDAIETVVYRNIYDKTQQTSAKALGLDERAARILFVDQDYIIVPEVNRGNLDYYGGFEYVGSCFVHVIGGFVFYSAQDERVQDHLDIYFHSSKDEDDFNSVTSREHY